jgi:hypothetical protein
MEGEADHQVPLSFRLGKERRLRALVCGNSCESTLLRKPFVGGENVQLLEGDVD